MTRLLPSLMAVLGYAGVSLSQEVVQVRWPTAQAAPVAQLHGMAKELLPVFRMGLASLPEASIVALCLSQPQTLGLSAAEGQELQRLTSARYDLMAEDAVFRLVPSALPYCFSETKPTDGLATMYKPHGCTSASPCIVFLHGYGGSFMWYLHVLAQAFPDHLIICPAYGLSCGLVPGAYIQGAMNAAEGKLGFKMNKPTLIGLSAGGFGGFMAYVQQPRAWRRMICLAAYARAPALQQVASGMDLCFMAGGKEFFVLDGSFERGVQGSRERGARVDSHLVPETGHFFLLQKREETVTILKRWLEE